jgi:hypothetical protein
MGGKMPDRFRPFGNKTFLITRQDLTRLTKWGGFHDPFIYAQYIKNWYKNKTAVIVAPGPSLNDIRPEIFSQKYTFALNNAMFWLKCPYYVSITEGRYGLWLSEQSGEWQRDRLYPFVNQNYIMTARAAIMWWKMLLPFRRIYITDHEETRRIRRCRSAITITNTIATVKYLGFRECIIYGMDLCKKDGPYVKGVPFSKFGAENPYDTQVKELMQVERFGLDIYNVNPYSNSLGLPMKPLSHAEALEKLKNAHI